uniref:Uncharacterized protein n=1 Tax=Oryzias sinensis TaxID=183150 RepID=A0A8C7Z3Y7_9TELE
VTFPVVVLLSHVLQPGQTEVRRRLVTLCYPGRKEVEGSHFHSFFTYLFLHFLKVKLRFKSPRGHSAELPARHSPGDYNLNPNI